MFKYGIRTFYLFIFKYPKYDIICLTRERIHRPWSPFSIVLGPVFRKPISANPGLNFNLGFYTSLFDSLFGIIFSTLYGASNHQTVDKKNSTEFSLKASRAEIRFHTNPGLSKPSFEQPSPVFYCSELTCWWNFAVCKSCLLRNTAGIGLTFVGLTFVGLWFLKRKFSKRDTHYK